MTLVTIKKLTMTNLLTISIAGLIVTIMILPASAHEPPYKSIPGHSNTTWFSNQDPDICFNDSQLNQMSVNRNTKAGSLTNPASQIKSEVNDSRLTINNAINGLTMNNDGTSCVFPYVQFGSKDLDSRVLAVENTIETFTNGTFQASQIHFAKGKHWQIENDNCSWWADKDVEWLANHELGHALSLGKHSGGNHSMMKGSCTSNWSGIQTVDDSALERRY